MEELVGRECQVVILGAGERKYEDALAYWGENYPEKVSCNLKYDFGLSCRIYAGCDMFLMPSLFEPCGISQLLAMRYGSLPLVRETGGLKDTVAPFNPETGEGTGFSFTNYNSNDMMHVLWEAINLYYNDKETWKGIVKNAMKKDVSWVVSADFYIGIYNELTGK